MKYHHFSIHHRQTILWDKTGWTLIKRLDTEMLITEGLKALGYVAGDE